VSELAEGTGSEETEEAVRRSNGVNGGTNGVDSDVCDRRPATPAARDRHGSMGKRKPIRIQGLAFPIDS
jgi:hypothetical protein